MGEVDMARQQPNVLRMRLLGAEVRPVLSGTRTLKDAVNEAIRDWVTNVRDTYYLLGSALGPHPYPTIVRDFQRVIGDEARTQMLSQVGRLPEAIIACVGGGSNAIGIFTAFLPDKAVRLIGVEAGGEGLETGRHAARFSDPRSGRPGVLQGTYTYVLQTPMGRSPKRIPFQPGWIMRLLGRNMPICVRLAAASIPLPPTNRHWRLFHLLAHLEGILPALESAHAVAEAIRLAPRLPAEAVLLVNLSGRGDKDLDTVIKMEARG